MIHKFSPKTIDELKYYVYIYSDPDTRKPFYVGKGKGNRAFAHMEDQTESDKAKVIKDIKNRGKEPIVEILAHGLDEETALKVEAAVIDLIEVSNLTNQHRGHKSSIYGKIDVDTLEARYAQRNLDPEEITDNLMLIRINKLYRNDMTEMELYDATRGYWRVNIDQARKVDYALAVYDGMVVEVYDVAGWYPALTTFTTRGDVTSLEDVHERYEFVGKVAAGKVRKRYVNRSVAEFFASGNANPIKYVFVKDIERIR